MCLKLKEAAQTPEMRTVIRYVMKMSAQNRQEQNNLLGSPLIGMDEMQNILISTKISEVKISPYVSAFRTGVLYSTEYTQFYCIRL